VNTSKAPAGGEAAGDRPFKFHPTTPQPRLTPPQPRGSLRSPRPSRSSSRLDKALIGARHRHVRL